MTHSLQSQLHEALAATEIEQKLVLTVALRQAWHATPDPLAGWQTLPVRCGAPAKPPLVGHKDVPQRGVHAAEGRARLLHAIAHIEFTAINLALDHAARFAGMPRAYYDDWIDVAAEEASHFVLIRERLRAYGHEYGDFPAHASLWQMAERTAHDPLARMALVPRMLEARGLDATPPIQRKLIEAGDTESASALDVILNDEIGHVGLGDRWFKHLCGQRDLDPENTYRELLMTHHAPKQPANLNLAARLKAGFSERELAMLSKKM